MRIVFKVIVTQNCKNSVKTKSGYILFYDRIEAIDGIIIALFTVIRHDGFKMAMITRGGYNLECSFASGFLA